MKVRVAITPLLVHHIKQPPSLFLQSNANVLQPSAQQRRLRLVLRAGFLLAHVRPPGGRQATVPLLTDGQMENECWWNWAYFGLVFGHKWCTHMKAHTPTSLEAASPRRESKRGEHSGSRRNLSLSLWLYSCCLAHSGWRCVFNVCVPACVSVWSWHRAIIPFDWPTRESVFISDVPLYALQSELLSWLRLLFLLNWSFCLPQTI